MTADVKREGLDTGHLTCMPIVTWACEDHFQIFLLWDLNVSQGFLMEIYPPLCDML